MNLKFEKLARQILSEGIGDPEAAASVAREHNKSLNAGSRYDDGDMNNRAMRSQEQNAGVQGEANKIRITTKEGKKKFYSVGGTVKTYPGTKAGMEQANAACRKLKAQDWVSDAVVVAG